MSDTVAALLEKIKALESELEVEVAKTRVGLQFGFEHGRVAFEEQILQRHRELMTRLHNYVLNARPLVVLTAPAIYSLIIPFVIIDVWVMLYQEVCFPVYGIAKVRRRDYLVFDRQYLAYLNVLEKLNCGYCSYVAGTVAFVREVAARTEQHWCPIKHARKVISAHHHYGEFLEFGDAPAYREWVATFASDRKVD